MRGDLWGEINKSGERRLVLSHNFHGIIFLFCFWYLINSENRQTKLENGGVDVS